MAAALSPFTFQPLDEDAAHDEPVPVTATGRTLQKKLQMYGVAHGRGVGAKRKAEGAGISDTTFLCVCLLLVAGGIAMALFLTLRD